MHIFLNTVNLQLKSWDLLEWKQKNTKLKKDINPNCHLLSPDFGKDTQDQLGVSDIELFPSKITIEINFLHNITQR